jgi:hypothetical protein
MTLEQPRIFIAVTERQSVLRKGQMLCYRKYGLVLLDRMLRPVERQARQPARYRVIILLSVQAGLRAAEIAQLRWSMVLDAHSRVADSLTVSDRIAKNRHGQIQFSHTNAGSLGSTSVPRCCWKLPSCFPTAVRNLTYAR